MPKRHCIFFIITFLISFILASQTSMRERIFLYVLHQIETEALEPVKHQDLLAGALTGMVQTTADYPYTSWLPPDEKKEYENELQGKIAGIGIFHLRKEFPSGNYTFIPLPESPASKAGLQYGDRIVQVDETKVAKLSIKEFVNLLRGHKGTTVSLTVLPRNSKDTKKIKIVRDLIQQDIVCGDHRNSDGSWNYTLKEDPSIGYIRITQFADLTVPDFLLALADLLNTKIKGLILDFRGNPGGFLPAAVTLCDYFVPEGSKIVTTRRRNGSIKREYIATSCEKIDFPLIILIDEGSASASEIVAACLQDHNRATIVGSRSYGKGTIQELFPLPCGMGLLRLTDASFWRPSNIPLHRFQESKEYDPWGVQPDPQNTVPLSEFQSMVLLWIQDLRGSLNPDQAEQAVHDVLKEIESFDQCIQTAKTKDDLKKIYQEFGFPLNEDPIKDHALKDKNGKHSFELPNLKLEGSSPRFDPQLDRALSILKNQ